MFSSSGHNRMGSNATTDQNQGGGSKKAGIPTRVGINAWIFAAYTHRGNGMLNLQNMKKNRFKYAANQNKPVGSPVNLGKMY